MTEHAAVDTYLCIASKRDTRSYAARPIEPDVTARILEAGRLAGNALNRQQRRFWVLDSAAARDRCADCVTRPGNLRGAALAVAISGPSSGWGMFDAARMAQNMMLAAWSDGVASCPNTVKDPAPLAGLIPLEAGDEIITVLSFGYPASGREPRSRSLEDWIGTADRLPLDELVTHVTA